MVKHSGHLVYENMWNLYVENIQKQSDKADRRLWKIGVSWMTKKAAAAHTTGVP